MSQVLHKLKRLAAMSPRELAHRVREKSWVELERRGMRLSDADPVAFKCYLAGEPARRFYCGPREPLRKFISENVPGWIDRAVEEADKLCQRQMRILNFDPVQLGSHIDWHRDPVIGRQWEKLFWSDYRLENDPQGRDAKIVLELNRHQHLPRLAKAYYLTGDERYAAEAVAQMESWIEQNPPGLGINWHSSLEIGIRAISWLWTMFLLLESKSFDEAAAQRAGDSLFAQLEHVHRYTSVFSSPNTHLIGEAAALFIVGLVFRDRKRPSAWLARGASLLAEAADKQILEDGVYGELSSYYHSYALDFFMQAIVLAEQNGLPFPERTSRKVCGMAQVLMHWTHPDGSVPLLGDDDGGCVLGLAKLGYHSSRDALCLSATLFRREDLKHQAGAFSEEALWMMGVDGCESYQRLKSRPPKETAAYFPSGGYVSQRSGWTPEDSHMIFDCGGLGMLTGGHAHADALSIVLFGRGRELLADPGTFVYNGVPELRRHFRSTSAHNTVVVDRRDQADMGGTFSWKTKTSTRSTNNVHYVEAEHDGYNRLPGGGVIHRRRVVNIESKYWILVDDFRGTGQHTFDFHFQLGADVEVSTREQSAAGLVMWAEQAGFLLALHACHPVEVEESVGWLSRGYGEKHPATALRASVRASAPTGAITFIAPARAQPKVTALEVSGGSAIACSYESDGFRDVSIWSAGDSVLDIENFNLQGEFFWLRTEGGVLKKALAIGARSLLFEGRNVLEDELCARSAAS